MRSHSAGLLKAQPVQQAAAKRAAGGTTNSSSRQQDPWTRGIVRLQYLPPDLQGSSEEVKQRIQQLQKLHGTSGPFLHKQKNWNAFIYNDELYFSQVGSCVFMWGVAVLVLFCSWQQ